MSEDGVFLPRIAEDRLKCLQKHHMFNHYFVAPTAAQEVIISVRSSVYPVGSIQLTEHF